MDRTKLKKYAPQARLDFIQAMVDQAAFYGITVDRIEPMTERGDIAVIAGRELPISIAKKRKKLEERIRRDGFHQTMEAIAYTWFNRLVAIRYMELKGYFEHGYRVLSHPDNKPIPEILQYAEYLELPGLKKDLVIEWKLDGSKESELYRSLLTAQCNALSRTIPFLFGWIDDETELLLPNNLLKTDSLIRALVENLSAEDCESVEVLGWLYQFYISERKDQVMARKSAVPTEDIPAVTQLFTPHWIVRYLVENSLGRLWLLNRPGSRLREHMPYYIEGETETEFLKITKPEDIRLCDPAVGSGHMLTYAFDLLTLIYEEEGYAPTEIPALILRHNLHGLEICPRAAQLAELALVFKAREKSRRFFQPEHLVRPHIVELRNVHFEENELRDYIHALRLGDLFNQPVLRLLHQFEEAKNFGSLIQPCLDERAIAFARRAIEAKDLGGQLFLRETHLKVLRVLEQAEALTQRYHVVVANPPYMGSGAMNEQLRAFARDAYRSSRSDLMTMFLARAFPISLKGAFLAFVTLDSWMFLSSFESLRAELLSLGAIDSLIHIGWNCFPFGHPYNRGVGFVIMNCTGGGFGKYFNLSNVAATVDKEQLFLRNKESKEGCYEISQNNFATIPGSPVAYWISDSIRNAYQNAKFSDHFQVKEGLGTRDDEIFLRRFWEVSASRIQFSKEKQKWVKTDKAGGYRKWSHNGSFVMNWESDGYAIRNHRNPDGSLKSRPQNTQFFFRPAVSWGKVGSGLTSFRHRDDTWAFNDAAPSLFGADLVYALGLLNSKVFESLLELQGGTLNVTTGVIGSLPFIKEASVTDKTSKNVATLIEISAADWDNFETSWDFRDQPLLRPG